MKIYKVVFDCQMKELPVVMHPVHTYVEALSKKMAKERGWDVIKSNDENLEKLNITLADVSEERLADFVFESTEIKTVSVFCLSGEQIELNIIY